MANCKQVFTPMILGLKLVKDDGAPKADWKVYRSLIGSLLYLTISRPDILFAVNYLSRFMQEPSQTHFMAAKRILRYLQGTKNLGMHFAKNRENKLVGFTDSDWAGSDECMMSTSGYCFALGVNVFSWISKKQ